MTTLTRAEVNTDFDRTYTVEEFEELPEFDEDYELIDGRIVKKVPPSDAHGWASKVIIRQLALFDPEEKLGAIWPGTSVKLSSQNMPIPDLLFIVASRIPKKRSYKALKVIPDLVIEVWSPHDWRSQKALDDARLKVRMYQVVGVSIVWAINPHNQTVEVYHKGQLEPVRVLSIKDELDGEEVIPGFKLAVSKLFE
jgi:Uma2 family endonuclease